jgi:hypothetical protein
LFVSIQRAPGDIKSAVSDHTSKTNSVLNCFREIKDVVFSIPSRAKTFLNTL